MKTPLIYTIGHSNNSTTQFVDRLKLHNITAVCDVRSMPYSRINPQFNRETLKASLSEIGIRYVFLGKELGARSDDKSCYRNGLVSYPLLSNTKLFKDGLSRVREGALKYQVALMCAEKEPLDCHRTILVSRHLAANAYIKHILADGTVETHEQALARLIRMLHIPPADMFRSDVAVVDDAYARREEQIAYRERTGEGEGDDRRTVRTSEI